MRSKDQAYQGEIERLWATNAKLLETLNTLPEVKAEMNALRGEVKTKLDGLHDKLAANNSLKPEFSGIMQQVVKTLDKFQERYLAQEGCLQELHATITNIGVGFTKMTESLELKLAGMKKELMACIIPIIESMQAKQSEPLTQERGEKEFF